MADDPVATRYAQAVFESAKAEGGLDEVLEQLTLLGSLISQHPDLRQLVGNPDVDPDEKVGVLDRIVQGSWSGLVRAFVRMVVSMGRAELLPDVAQAFQAMVDAERGRLKVVVRSAYPIPEATLKRLRARLEQRERKHVELRAEVAPELIGGMQVILGHRVVDGSVQRQLVDLRERLAAVRVH